MKHYSSSLKIFLFLFIYITFVLFVISPDSYTHDLYGRSDSAWFFMCGKAWMNGLVPYVDFTDSKGPLLWLIYGLAYLVDNYTYIGVFWISCLTYAITLFFNYKTAFLLTANKRQSLFVAMAMILPYFLYWCHYEIRAEDFCQPFIAGGLFYLLSATTGTSKKEYISAGLFIGVGLMSCVLIKWSVGLMYISFVSAILLLAYVRHYFKQTVVMLSTGALFVFLPFVVYFVSTGSFSAFIGEYFQHTAISVHLGFIELLITYAKEWGLTLSSYKLLYLAYAFAIYYLYTKKSGITLLPLLCCIFFLALSIRNDLLYYTTVMAPFAVFSLVVLYQYLNRYTSFLFVLIILSFQARNLDKYPNLFFHEEYRKDFYTAAYVMSQVDQPTIINEGHEIGIGTPVNALPGTRYWSQQNGETEEMRSARHADIKSGKADFVTCSMNPQSDRDHAIYKMITDAGYICYCRVHYRDDYVYLYGRPGHLLPDSAFNVTNKDVLYKRKLF